MNALELPFNWLTEPNERIEKSERKWNKAKRRASARTTELYSIYKIQIRPNFEKSANVQEKNECFWNKGKEIQVYAYKHTE